MNHHNYDAVRLFSYAWKYLDRDIKLKISSEIEQMLNWCLKSSLKSDGSFPMTPTEETIGDAYYFGVSFLQEIGFFDQKKRFWTKKEFKDSEDIRRKILNRIKSENSKDLFIRETIAILSK